MLFRSWIANVLVGVDAQAVSPSIKPPNKLMINVFFIACSQVVTSLDYLNILFLIAFAGYVQFVVALC